MAAMGVLSRAARRSLGVSVEKSFEITCQAFLVSFRAVRRVHHQEPVSEGRVRDHHDNVGYLVVLKAIE